MGRYGNKLAVGKDGITLHVGRDGNTLWILLVRLGNHKVT